MEVGHEEVERDKRCVAGFVCVCGVADSDRECDSVFGMPCVDGVYGSEHGCADGGEGLR